VSIKTFNDFLKKKKDQKMKQFQFKNNQDDGETLISEYGSYIFTIPGNGHSQIVKDFNCLPGSKGFEIRT